LVGPGIEREDEEGGVDHATFSDHTDIRPTMLTLVGLRDDYAHEGRALVEKFSDRAVPSAIEETISSN
jgi:hypothetical protein